MSSSHSIDEKTEARGGYAPAERQSEASVPGDLAMEAELLVYFLLLQMVTLTPSPAKHHPSPCVFSLSQHTQPWPETLAMA